MRLAIISSHPIQYNAPMFKLLTERKQIDVKVFYTWGQAKDKVYDPGFGKERKWDIPLLDGYDYEFIENISKDPGSHHFMGIQNPTLIKKIDLYNPDAILVFGWSFKSHLKILRHYHRKKNIFFRGDSNLIDEPKSFSVKKILRKLFLKWVYSHVDVAFYVGSANKKYFIANGLKEQKLVFAPHAIDNDRFQQASLVNYREKLNIAKDAVVFLFAGKLEPKKDPEILIRAFIEIDKQNSHLVIVGNGILEDNLKSLVDIQSDDIKSRIHFLSFQNQGSMPDLYKSADVFCLPSQGPGETWGLAVNEAMACSTAIIVSNKCGCSADLVKDNVNGFIFDATQINELKLKMEYLTQNIDLINEMKIASLNIIKDWSYAKICSALEQSI